VSFARLGTAAGALLLLGSLAQGQDSLAEARKQLTSAPISGQTFSAQSAREARDLGLEWILENQRENGSWAWDAMDSLQETFFNVETFYAWKLASHAIVCMALLKVETSPRVSAALERGLTYLVETRDPKRGNTWDIDYTWGALYAYVACTEAAADGRFDDERWKPLMRAAGERYLDILLRLQTPFGGWAYYDNPIYSRRPKWDTSFCTAMVLPALKFGLEAGWLKDPAVLARAQKYVSRCALPNGAYTYSLNPIPRINGGTSINRVKGSLARIQVCNWGLAQTGIKKITQERLREGLGQFMQHHRFLDAARMRPIPHEAYYANAGYFYMFGHYYAAEAIQLLPEVEREAWHAQLRPHIMRAQNADGASVDFLNSSYDKAACTAYLVLGLTLGLPPLGQ
jgi:hypothetical protein